MPSNCAVESPGPPVRNLRVRDHFSLSCLWFAFNVQWGALLPVVLPAQVAEISEPRKELFNGLVLAIGALVAMFVSPVAGALSDRCTSKYGPRRPYMVTGIFTNCLLLAVMSFFGRGSNIWLFILCFIGVQFAGNLWGGPYAGLIPDLVSMEHRGSASAWLMFMTILGNIAGVGVTSQLITRGNYFFAYGLIIVSMLVCLAITVTFVRETPLQSQPESFALKNFVRSFYLSPKRHSDFYWVLVTRTMVTMGVYAVYNFFQYFLRDIIHLGEKAVAIGGIIFAGAAIVSLPFGFWAGRLSDRYGRKKLVIASGGLMAMTSIIYVLIAFHASLLWTALLATAFAIGSAAYQTVDWALAIDVLPSLDNAGKDMGIWHIALVLPQILAPAMTGGLLSYFKTGSLALGYTVVFLVSAFWFSAGAILVSKVQGVK